MSKSLVERWKPESLDDIYGHPSAIDSIKEWAENWNGGTEPLLLYGPPGTGKTSTAEAVSNSMEWAYVEINASSQRTGSDIQRLAQEIRSKGNRHTLYVLDEVDSMDGRSISSLYEVLDDAPNPVICTANEKWKVPDGLESRCKTFKFRLKQKSIKKFLKDVVREEDIDISNRQIGQLATRDGIRDALNDLQEYTESGQTSWDNRETEDSPFGVTRRIILNKNYTGDITPDDTVAFLNENVKNEFDGVEAMRAYQAIAEADKWLHFVNQTQDYSWWRYAGSISEEVSNLRITEPYNDWVNVDYPKERRNYTPSPDSETNEAQLYEDIQKADEYSGSFNFHEFRKVILPLLEDLSDEEKFRLALSHNLSSESLSAIGVSENEFEDWRRETVEDETTSDSSISDFVDAGSKEEEETQSIFDF